MHYIKKVKDSNSALLNDGDTVKFIKNLKVKGILKRGTVVKIIKLTDDEDEVD